MSLSNMHNLHPSQRADVFAKLKHALNVEITGLVDVTSICDVLDNKAQVPQQVRDYYEHVKLPTKDEGTSSAVETYNFILSYILILIIIWILRCNLQCWSSTILKKKILDHAASVE